jgi:hypothetical protein
MPDVHHDKPMQGVFMLSTNSTAQGYSFDNNIPVVIAYAGYKSISGNFVYDETDIDRYPIIAVEDKGDLIASGRWNILYTPWTKIGYNPDSGVGAEEVVCYQGGMPAWPASSGMPLSVISGSNNDKTGSTGCTKVWVKYLDADYIERSTTVTMDGTTGVAIIDTSISRINSFQAYEGNAAAGNISIYPATGGVMSQIGVGMTRARNSMYTVPSSKTLFIKNFYYSGAALGSGKGVPTRFLLKSNYSVDQDRYSTSLFWPLSANLLTDSPIYASLSIPLKLPEKTDMFVSATLTAASSANIAECILRGWTVDNA